MTFEGRVHKRRPRKLLLTVAALLVAFGTGVLLAHWHEPTTRDAALKSAGLADVPTTATNVMVTSDRRFLFCEVDVVFYDTEPAIDKWLAASRRIERTMVDGEFSERNYYADSRHNKGANVQVDRGSGRVDTFVAFEECP
jgi:hypothetical protein